MKFNIQASFQFVDTLI